MDANNRPRQSASLRDLVSGVADPLEANEGASQPLLSGVGPTDRFAPYPPNRSTETTLSTVGSTTEIRESALQAIAEVELSRSASQVRRSRPGEEGDGGSPGGRDSEAGMERPRVRSRPPSRMGQKPSTPPPNADGDPVEGPSGEDGKEADGLTTAERTADFFRQLHIGQLSLGAGLQDAVISNISTRFLRVDQATFRRINAIAPAAGSNPVSPIGVSVLNPNSTFVLLWTLIMLVIDATYSAFIVPLTMAFDSGNGAKTGSVDMSLLADLFTGVIFGANLFLGFHVGYTIQHGTRRVVVRHGMTVARLYTSSYHFWIDLMAVVPLFFQLLFLAISTEHEKAEVLAFRLVRLIRVSILIRGVFAGKFSALGVIGGVSAAALHVFQMLYLVAFLTNLLACLLLAVGRSQSGASWLEGAGGDENEGDLRDSAGSRQYLAALYYTTTTISTTGFGDISPKTALEQGVAILLQMCGVIFFAFITSNFTQMLSAVSASARFSDEYRTKISALNTWCRKARFPPGLENRLRAFYDRSWQTKVGIDEAHLVSELPPFLKAEVAQHSILKLLKRIASFRYLDHFTIESFAAMGHFRKFAAGHELFHQGEPADSLIVAVEGEIAVIEGGLETALIDAPAALGEVALLWMLLDVSRPRYRTYRSYSQVSAWEIKTADISHLIESMPKCIIALAKGLREHLQSKGSYYPWISLDIADLELLVMQAESRLAGVDDPRRQLGNRAGPRDLEQIERRLSDSDSDGADGPVRFKEQQGKMFSFRRMLQGQPLTASFKKGGSSTNLEAAGPSTAAAALGAPDTGPVPYTAAIPSQPPLGLVRDASDASRRSTHRRTGSVSILTDVGPGSLSDTPRSAVPAPLSEEDLRNRIVGFNEPSQPIGLLARISMTHRAAATRVPFGAPLVRNGSGGRSAQNVLAGLGAPSPSGVKAVLAEPQQGGSFAFLGQAETASAPVAVPGARGTAGGGPSVEELMAEVRDLKALIVRALGQQQQRAEPQRRVGREYAEVSDGEDPALSS